MARTTFQNALTELYGLLASDANGTPRTGISTAGCAKVYSHEPGAGGIVKPCSITLSPAGIDPTDWRVAVRVYAQDNNPAKCQDLIVDVTVAAGTLLAGGQGYGPDRWDYEFVDEIKAWVASSEVMVGREDGF